MDDLGRRVRDADPSAGHSLPDHALKTLDDIVAGRRLPRRRPSEMVRPRSRVLPGIVGVSGFVVVIAVIIAAFLVVLKPQSAMAATPSPLPLSATASTVDTLREELMSGEIPPGAHPSRPGAEWEGWYLQMDENNKAPDYIQSQITQLTWNPDLSGTTRIVAGIPMRADGAPLSPIPSGADVPGTVVTDEVFGAGEFGAPFPDEPPTTAQAMRTYLDAYLDQSGGNTSYSAGDYLSALVFLMQTWTLNDAAQRAAIEVLLGAPGITVAGTTTDRAGRAGVVLAIDATDLDPLHHDDLIIDSNAWRILADDRLYVGGSPDLPIKPGSVTEYTIWR